MQAPEPATEDYLRALRHAAIRLLARREHSREELRQKLHRRERPDEVSGEQQHEWIENLLTALHNEGLQCDRRFSESYANMRIHKGYGPQRIDNELRERGVSETIRCDTLQSLVERGEVDWWLLMRQVREKKFGHNIPDDYAARSRQMRFLQYRGFASEQIRELLA